MLAIQLIMAGEADFELILSQQHEKASQIQANVD